MYVEYGTSKGSWKIEDDSEIIWIVSKNTIESNEEFIQGHCWQLKSVDAGAQSVESDD